MSNPQLFFQSKKMAINALEHFVRLIKASWCVGTDLALKQKLFLCYCIELDFDSLSNTPKVLEVALHYVLEYINRFWSSVVVHAQ